MLLLLFTLMTPGSAQEPRAIDLLVDRIHSLEAEKQAVERQVVEMNRQDPRRAALLEEMDALTLEAQELRNRFIALSTGVDPTRDESDSGPLAWDEELQELLSPIFTELRTVTERPRRIEALKTQVKGYEQRIAEADGALAQLEGALSETSEEDTRAELAALQAEWQETRATSEELNAITAQELAELSQASRSIGEVTQEVIQIFFHRRGRNLIIALVSFLSVFAGVRLLNRALLRAVDRRNIDTSSSIRVIQLIFYVIGSLGAVGAALIALYVLGDWFLLSLGIIGLVGIGWALREAVPRVLEELKLMLNFGSVREGERIIWDGVPWKIERINFRAVLVNPAFEAPLQIQLRHLIDQISRPVGENEPWFPTRPGDHVRFVDGQVGEVTGQGPDLVTVRTEVGPRTMPTAAFLAAPIINLSRGFGVETLLPIHPRHADAAADAIPEALAAVLEQILAETPVAALSVRLHRIERDALLIRALVDFDGAAAAAYHRLSDTIQAALLRCCRENGWTLAVPQLEVTTTSGG